MTRQEQRHALRNQADVESVRRTDANPAGQVARAGLEQRHTLVDLPQRTRSKAAQQFTRLGGHHLLADAFEQRLADLFFELPYLVRQGRLGDVNAFRRPREAQAIAQRDEVPQMPHLHENPHE
jgi:hypothetical protein